MPAGHRSDPHRTGDRLDVPAAALTATVARFNDHVPADGIAFDPARCDHRATAPGLAPPKSNWARRIERPPYRAWPLCARIAYGFGGIATNAGAEVLGNHGVIPGLWAAGEITGHFHGTAPNAVSVLRGLVFGRLAGRGSVEHLAGVAAPIP